MGIRKGTKLTDTPKDKTLKIRIDEQTEWKLLKICELTQKSKAQVIRDGINKQFAEVEE